MHNNLVWQADKEIKGYIYALFEACQSEIELLQQKITDVELLENFFLTELGINEVLAKVFQVKSLLEENANHKPIVIYSLYRVKGGEYEFVGMGGIISLGKANVKQGQIWFLSEPMEKHSRFLVLYSKVILNLCLEKYEVLFNVVAAWNNINIKWLKRLGFYVETKPRPLGNYQTLYHKFWITRKS